MAESQSKDTERELTSVRRFLVEGNSLAQHPLLQQSSINNRVFEYIESAIRGEILTEEQRLGEWKSYASPSDTASVKGKELSPYFGVGQVSVPHIQNLTTENGNAIYRSFDDFTHMIQRPLDCPSSDKLRHMSS